MDHRRPDNVPAENRELSQFQVQSDPAGMDHVMANLKIETDEESQPVGAREAVSGGSHTRDGGWDWRKRDMES